MNGSADAALVHLARLVVKDGVSLGGLAAGQQVLAGLDGKRWVAEQRQAHAAARESRRSSWRARQASQP